MFGYDVGVDGVDIIDGVGGGARCVYVGVGVSTRVVVRELCAVIAVYLIVIFAVGCCYDVVVGCVCVNVVDVVCDVGVGGAGSGVVDALY